MEKKLTFEKVTTDMIDNKELVDTLNKNFDMIADALETRDKYMFDRFDKMDRKIDTFQQRTEKLLTEILKKIDPNANVKLLLDSEEPKVES